MTSRGDDRETAGEDDEVSIMRDVEFGRGISGDEGWKRWLYEHLRKVGL